MTYKRGGRGRKEGDESDPGGLGNRGEMRCGSKRTAGTLADVAYRDQGREKRILISLSRYFIVCLHLAHTGRANASEVLCLGIGFSALNGQDLHSKAEERDLVRTNISQRYCRSKL